MITFLVILILFLALVGAPIFAVMAGLAFVGAAALDPSVPVVEAITGGLSDVLGMATNRKAITLSTIPLFTLAGYIMAESRTAERMVAFARALVGWIPGGLALVTIVACAIFTTFTGASGVTIVAIGGLLLPSLVKEKYPERFSLGLISSTGSIGLLFPPALPLIVYGIVYGINASASVDESGEMALSNFDIHAFLFAGIVPGIILLALVGGYAMVVAIREGVPRTEFDGKKALQATIRSLPELMIPVLIIVTLVTGILQIPGAAAITALYVLLIEAVLYRDVRIRDLPRIARESINLVGAIFIVMVAATALTSYFSDAEVPDRLYTWMGTYIESKWTFLLALNVLLLIVGCLMDIFSAIVVVVPLIAPAAARYGIDPYHLGVVFLLNLEIGYLTPPVGLNLFITSFRFEKPIVEVYKAALPFLLVMLVALGLVTYIPALTVVKAKKPNPRAQASPVEIEKDTHFTLDDGSEWTAAKCNEDIIHNSSVHVADCRNLFTSWQDCQKDTTTKAACESKVKEQAALFQGRLDEAAADDDDWD